MKGTLTLTLSLLCGATVFGQAKPADKTKGQETEVTTVRSETKTVMSPWDITTELWSFEDAVPINQGQWDLRFTTRWFPEPGADDEDDDIIFQPSLVWGVAENWELSVNVPFWLGDAGDRGAYDDGNYDTYLGSLWRFRDQEGYWPAMALAGHVRVPTGSGSAGLDGELRLVLTNEYDSGLRSHLNVWGKTANGDNDGHETRDFQYGGVAGLDGRLFGKDHVRWVLDYVYRISNVNGGGGEHLTEVGWEWKISDIHKLGMSTVFSLDHAADEVAEYGFSLTWAWTLAQ